MPVNSFSQVIYNSCQLSLFDTIEKLHHPVTVQEVADKLSLNTEMPATSHELLCLPGTTQQRQGSQGWR